MVEVIEGAFGFTEGFCKENTDCLSSGRGLNTLPGFNGAAAGVSVVGGLKTGWVVVGFWNIGGGFVETEGVSLDMSG